MAAANSESTKVVALGGHTKRCTIGLNRTIMKRRLNYNVKPSTLIRVGGGTLSDGVGTKKTRLLVVYRIYVCDAFMYVTQYDFIFYIPKRNFSYYGFIRIYLHGHYMW